MERRDQRQGLPLRILVLEVPALKIGACSLCAVEKRVTFITPDSVFPESGILYRITLDQEEAYFCPKY